MTTSPNRLRHWEWLLNHTIPIVSLGEALRLKSTFLTMIQFGHVDSGCYGCLGRYYVSELMSSVDHVTMSINGANKSFSFDWRMKEQIINCFSIENGVSMRDLRALNERASILWMVSEFVLVIQLPHCVRNDAGKWLRAFVSFLAAKLHSLKRLPQ